MQACPSLTPRLKAIADLVAPGARLADVGTDHGYLPVYLVKQGIIPFGIAADINPQPLARARETVMKYDAAGEVKVVLSDGFEDLPVGEADTVVVAGMGGTLISEIMMRSQEFAESVKTFIFQPMTAAEQLRMYLCQNKMRIVNEVIAKEGRKLYNILVAEHGEEAVEDELHYYIGKKLIENRPPHYDALLRREIQKYKTQLRGLERSRSGGSAERYAQVEGLLAKMTKLL